VHAGAEPAWRGLMFVVLRRSSFWFGSRPLCRQGGPARAVSVQSRFVWIVSHVAELTIFFGAAAALGAGLLGLR
jgi:hypothetical protein